MASILVPLLSLLGPLALVAAALSPAAGPAVMARRAEVAALTGLAAALAGLAHWALSGAHTPAGWAALVYVDALSAIMLLLVSFVGAVVVRYSRNYLDGDPGQERFFRWLCLTLAAVLVLIVSGNLLTFLAAWVATSMGLHRLLLFYGERTNARLAARKKFVVSRIGDACLLVAAVLLWHAFGSLDFATIFAGAEIAHATGVQPANLTLIALLLVAGALLKSAQFPFHGWLLEVMETPTPVSALLHAGIINAGGFLILRFADVIALSVPALDTLAIIGGATAMFGSVVMLTQTSV